MARAAGSTREDPRVERAMAGGQRGGERADRADRAAQSQSAGYVVEWQLLGADRPGEDGSEPLIVSLDRLA